jgi:hypothetical protein
VKQTPFAATASINYFSMNFPFSPEPAAADRSATEAILGYLNFSTGRPEAAVQAALNQLFADIRPTAWEDVRQVLSRDLEKLCSQSPAFKDAHQAEVVLEIVFGQLLPVYLRHHADLLFHLSATDLLNPFFLARLFEAVLDAGAPWTDAERITEHALTKLNDYVGHRPIAVLENGRKAEVYPHERFRPVPLYLKGAGIAVGPYHELMRATFEHIAATPADLLAETSFDPALLDELALDVRAHDAMHPVFKRTNYLFGEWDPHQIDQTGHYRRFVVRKVILDSLANWMKSATDLPPAERLHDASAVLCGTILMASAISGWGPAAHDSTMSLANLLPIVARQRDDFYARTMARVNGVRAARLAAVVEATRQPFGHVRQQLHIDLANFAAAQMQRRMVAEQFARMGYSSAARGEAERIPAASIRIECELRVGAESAFRSASRGQVAAAADHLDEASSLLVRGIECGALIDPWNILGFQGVFPLFIAREDSVPDHRAEWLIEMVERLFAVASHVLTEAAARGDAATVVRVRGWLDRTAEWWDRYATTTVSDLPAVHGEALAESAAAVAGTIAEWRAAGPAAGNLTFWRDRVERLETPEAFADVVDALLDRGDFVSASGLLVQWLSQSDDIGLGDLDRSFYSLAIRWLHELTGGPFTPPSHEQARLARRFFEFLESNAGEYWLVPSYSDPALGSANEDRETATHQESRDDDEEPDDRFSAAYEGMVYRDSTADDFEGEVLDSSPNVSGGEFEDRLKRIEPRLRFLEMLVYLWRIGAGRVRDDAEFDAAARQWQSQAKRMADDLAGLARKVAAESIVGAAGDLEANVEYDAQLQSKNHLSHLVVNAAVRMASAERLLRSRQQSDADGREPAIIVLRKLLAGDVAGVRRSLPDVLRLLAGRPLLYVAVENGGNPNEVIAARLNHDLLMTLATELPRLGLLREARQVLLTALRMERRSRPAALSVTEFDRLFRTTLEAVLRVAVNARSVRAGQALTRGRSRFFGSGALYGPPARRRPLRRLPIGRSSRWMRSAKAPVSARDEETVALVAAVVDRFAGFWLKHAATMRLTAVEALNDSTTWSEAKRFINRFGGELFHARVLPLSNLRAILAEGVDQFLDHLIEQDDPLHPSPLVAEITRDENFRRQASRLLELIYASVVDEIERFVEYNSTTTQSDYGERFDSFLDFLRAEAAYRRDEWDLTPLRITHEVLVRSGRDAAARLWEEVVRERTAAAAQKHLSRLRSLEKRHAMRLPSISDHFAEEFIKPFAINRILALVPAAVKEGQAGRREPHAFQTLHREIENYLATSTGSAAELPEWLIRLENAVTEALSGSLVDADDRQSLTGRSIPVLRPAQVLRQVSSSGRDKQRRYWPFGAI